MIQLNDEEENNNGDKSANLIEQDNSAFILNNINNNNNENNNNQILNDNMLNNNDNNINANNNNFNNKSNNNNDNTNNNNNINININNYHSNSNNNNITIPESESYMNLIENELSKYGHTLNDSLFISQIIIILDKLSEPNTFNKTLFNHILDFSKFDITQPIKLLTFFKSYFQVYNTMKINRDKIAYENIQLSNEVENTKTQILQYQSNEIIREDGTTNNSYINIIFKGINTDEDKSGIRIKDIHLNFNDQKISFDITSPYLNKEIKIYSMNELDKNLELYIKTDLEDKLVDSINPKSLLENQITRNYKYFEMSFLWINSLVNYLNKKIIKIEYAIKNSKDNISVLNTSINQMESIFKNYFSQIPRSQYSNYISGAMGNEMEISDKIENIILKTIGKDVIVIWEKIIYVLNKILFISILLELLLRFDIIAFGICFIIFFLEEKIFKKENLYYYLIILLSNIILDLGYFIHIIKFWNLHLPFDNQKTSLIKRKIGIVSVIINFFIKIIMCFSLWKIALQNKLNLINQAHANRVINSQLQNEFNLNLNRIAGGEVKDFRNEILKKTQLRNKENYDEDHLN